MLLMSFFRCAVLRTTVGLALGTLLLSTAAEEVQALEINVLAAGATESITRDVVETL
jgi:hypothetical protein